MASVMILASSCSHTHTHTRTQPIRDPSQHYCIPYILPSLGYLFIWSYCPPPLLLSPSVWNKRLRLGLDPSHFLLTSPSVSICRILWYIMSCLCVITSSEYLYTVREKEREALVLFFHIVSILWDKIIPSSNEKRKTSVSRAALKVIGLICGWMPTRKPSAVLYNRLHFNLSLWIHTSEQLYC